MGRKPNTEQRRAQIVEAMRGELADVGYERASIKSIAERAGLGAGLIHYHFASKQDILHALVDGLIEEADRRALAAAAAAEATTAQQQLAAWISARVGLPAGSHCDSHQDAEPVRTWITVIAEAMAQQGVRSRLASWLARDHAHLVDLFERCGAGPAAPARAALLQASVLGSFSLHALRVPGLPRGYAEPELLRWLELT